MASPKITVCMIVRDEAKGIGRAVASTRFLDPEYAVLDTGSVDGTQDILRSLGIEPVPFEWIGDFAAARNQALSLAKGEWVLSLDGDEVLAPFDHLEACSPEAAPASYLLEKRSYVDDYLQLGYQPCAGDYPLLEHGFPGYLSEPNDLLFRNLPGLSWKGAVHETIGQSIAASGGFSKPLAGAVIHNYGRHGRSGVAKSYKALVAKRLMQDPKDPVAWYYAGLEAQAAVALEEAERCFSVSLELGKRDYAIFGLAKTQLMLGKLSLAEQGFVDFLRMRPKEFPAWAGLLTATMLRKDQGRTDYYVAWAEKAGMGTQEVYRFAAYVSGKLGNNEAKESYVRKSENVASAAAGPHTVPDGAHQV